MATSPEELHTISHLARTFQHVDGASRGSPYDSAVLSTDTFQRNYLFSRVITAGVNMVLNLPEIGQCSSFHLLQYSGQAADTLTLQPNAVDQVNGGGLGVAKVYTSEGTALKLLVFAANNVWHTYHIGADPVTLTAGAGIQITGSFPNFTITNLNP